MKPKDFFELQAHRFDLARLEGEIARLEEQVPDRAPGTERLSQERRINRLVTKVSAYAQPATEGFYRMTPALEVVDPKTKKLATLSLGVRENHAAVCSIWSTINEDGIEQNYSESVLPVVGDTGKLNSLEWSVAAYEEALSNLSPEEAIAKGFPSSITELLQKHRAIA